ncbi:MAG: gamma-glutamyl-gamma-aminobutyrate hydrolase family protein [Gemmatimonadales bacterium]|nr:MAG: gamma-glutamyl-gamma-aminobutyrate hydrolase family protein [Gemmatimonadales bacterium]
MDDGSSWNPAGLRVWPACSRAACHSLIPERRSLFCRGAISTRPCCSSGSLRRILVAELFAAITASVHKTEVGIEHVGLEAGYFLGLRVSGLLPLIISPLDDDATRDRMMAAASALVLSGGEDVDPSLYGEEMNGSRGINRDRDAMEQDLLVRALDQEIPVLAICRGMQMLNVTLGGTLYQDLATDFGDSIDHHRWREFDASIHTVRVEGEELLENICDTGQTEQNSAHHQGVKHLASDLTPVGWAPDGLIEAVEYRRPGTAWTTGVQWHPERRIDRDCGVNRRLFELFGDAVRGMDSPDGARLLR